MIFYLVHYSLVLSGQTNTSELFQKRIRNYQYGAAATYGISMLALNQLWYADYNRTGFHAFNDNNQWLQMDKVGHVYSTYTLSKINFELLNHADLTEKQRKKVVYISSATSALFLTSIEVLDGFSSEWGFSWGDFAANSLGIVLFSSQELWLKKQLFQLKYSYQSSSYKERRPEVFGQNTIEGAFKDYNGQTYWLTTTLSDWKPMNRLKWLGVAIGYGADQMLSSNGRFFEGATTEPIRQFYFALDVDLTKIETNKLWLKKTFRVLNHLKVPAPTLELGERTQPKIYGLYF